MSFMHTVYGGNGFSPVDSPVPRVGEIYAVRQDGGLRWYEYNGRGEEDPSGNRGWVPNSGNVIGRGWNGFLHLVSGGDGRLYAVAQNGDLRWYQYVGEGLSDPTGGTGWAPNSGNVIGNGWQGLRFLFSTKLHR